ncbi:MAG: subtype B tannase [Pseudomonadota bacterium]|nr:subtype B tannase [Pseudomonadota bacterium]
MTRPTHPWRSAPSLGAAPVALALAAGLVACSHGPGPAPQPNDPLAFDPARYQTQQVTVSGQTIAVRAWENVVYVRQPVDARYQAMNIYVPEAYFQKGGSVGGYTAATAPIFLPNQVGGYMPALPGTAQPPTQGPGAGKTSTIAQALARGYVVASPGARGRTLQGSDGRYTGKAPAAIVDLKAAVRWLHHNDTRMPGDARKIISNGTSAGGALSALLGASGNHPDYAAALRALGAAEGRDDIFAVSAYCPITNLEHADAAYEWQFQGVNAYTKIDIRMLDYHVERKEIPGTLNAAQQATSAALAPQFVSYINALGLRSPQGQALTLNAQGDGPFKEYVQSWVIASAQQQLDAGQRLADFPWLRIQGGKVQGMDFAAYARAIGRAKTPPAFDALDLGSGENQLFGSALLDKRHFTAYATRHSTADKPAEAPTADATTVRMMNAMAYLGDGQATAARHWRVRHGTHDRDTSLAIPVLLATAAQAQGLSVDFALPWNRPHSGDYDLDELFAWMAQVAATPVAPR